MSTQTNGLSAKAQANLDFIHRLHRNAEEQIEEAGELKDLDLEDGFAAYSEDTTFYYMGREYKGYAGIRDFLAPVSEFKQNLLDTVDIWAGDERVGLVINEQCERVSDGAKFDFSRNVIYKIVDEKIAECWIWDYPCAWGIQEFHDKILAGA